MKKEVITRLSKNFEDAAYIEQDIEYWMARDIQEFLEYNDWRNFLNVIEKAKVACEKSGQIPNNHFGEVTKMVKCRIWKQKKNFRYNAISLYLLSYSSK